MSWTVHALQPAKDFLMGLDADEYEMFDAALKLLEEHGPNLGEPLVKLIVSSSYPKMKELRRQSKGKIFRLLFAFDSKRRAVLLVGGNKAEDGFDDFYTVSIPLADELFAAHLADCKAEDERNRETKVNKNRKQKGRRK